MGARPRIRMLLRFTALLVPLAVLAAGCTTNDPFDTLTNRGDTSTSIRNLFWPVLGIAAVVFVAVELLLLYTIIRYRRRTGGDELPVQTHGNTRLEVTWTIIPAVILAGIAVPTIGKIVELSEKPASALTVDVIAHQWWWEFHYSDPNGGQNKVVVANEMHIPAGRKIIAQITSEDVIHSFWVPNLAGKQDAVPNHINDLVFNANEPGVYRGECAEFCLDSHALMHFLVIAEPADQFNAWLTNQAKQQTAPPTSPSAQRGQQVFLANACIGCHAVEGSPAQGRTAPNLTHVGTRTTIGANRLENTPADVAAWIHNPQAFKPGAKMPAWAGVLSDDDINAVVDYLESLK